MRKTILALLLLMGLSFQTQAGIFTHGNIFAEALAGCSIGMSVGLVTAGIMYYVPIAGMQVTSNVAGLGGCLTGVGLSAIANSYIYGIPDLTHPIGDDDTKVYPETFGREY
ncbi:hypothetical protein TI03_07055 [Achromatium sp. WMS1]|nr:hypothetical protein TI03_07055 [Achromatium sp. WMS1]